MLRLQIHNDGKEKYQSFEARLDDRDTTIYLEGYGENKDEAIENLKKQVDLKIKELQEIDWETFDWVSWNGEVL